MEWLRRYEAISPTTRERYQDALNWYLIPAIRLIRVEELSTPIVDAAIRNIYIDPTDALHRGAYRGSEGAREVLGAR